MSGHTIVTGPHGRIDLRPKERSTVAALALHHPDPSTAASLAPLVWGDDVPATALKSLHNHVLRIRRAAPGLIDSGPDGYRLSDDVVVRAPGTASSYADLAEQPRVTLARARDRGRALDADEAAVVAELETGASDQLLVRLDALVADAPHRLMRWWWLAVVTARLGRRRDAIEVVRSSRSWLARHDDSPRDRARLRALGKLELAIIEDDLFLDGPAALDPEAFGTDGGDVRVHGGSRGGRPIVTDPAGAIRSLAAVIDGGARTIQVTAPAGGGKTTALRGLAEIVPSLGWVCFSATCSPDATDPLEPVDALVRARRERLGSAVDLPDAGAPSSDRTAVLLELLVAPTTRRVLLVVDDVHRSDSPTRDHLRALVRRVAGSDGRVAVVVAGRVGLDDVSWDAEIELPSWDVSAMADFLSGYVSPGTWAHDAAEWMAVAADGSPLAARRLMVDVLRTFPDDPSDAEFVAPATSAGLGAPAGGGSSDVAALAPNTQATLRAAAILGDEFRASDVARLVADAATGLAAAEAHDLVESIDDDVRRFTHQTVRQSFLEAMDDVERAELAHRAALGTTVPSPTEDAARHAERIGLRARLARAAASLDPELAITSTLEEAELASARSHAGQQLSTARFASGLIEAHEGRTGRWCRAAVMAGRAAIDVGEEGGVAALTAAGDRAIELGEHDAVGEAAWALCALSPQTQIGRISDAERRFLDHVSRHVTDPRIRALASTGAAFSWSLADDAPRARRAFDDAELISRELGDDQLRANVLERAFTPLMMPSDVALRRRLSSELHALGDRFDRDVYRWAATRMDFGDAIHAGVEDPRPHMQTLEDIAAVLRYRGHAWSLFSFRTTVAQLDGDLERARRHRDDLLTEPVIGSQLVASTHGALSLGIAIADDRPSELDPAVVELVRLQPDLAIWRAVRALTAAEVDPRASRESFDSVVGPDTHLLPETFTMTSGLLALGEAAVRLGDVDRMSTMRRHLTPFAGFWAWFQVGTLGPIDLTLARLARGTGDDAAADEHARRALRSCLAVGAPVLAARCAPLIGAARRDHTTPGGRAP